MDRILTQVIDATMFKLQIYHQYVHSKNWLLWANLKKKISALLTETHYSGPRRTEMSVYEQIFQKPVKAVCITFLWRPSRLWLRVSAPLVRLTSVSCSVWTCSRLATAMLGTTKHAAKPSCVANKRSESIPENTGTQEEFKQLFLSKVFWQSLRNKKKFFSQPTSLNNDVNSREHLIRNDSSSCNPGLCGAGLWHFLWGYELCKLVS